MTPEIVEAARAHVAGAPAPQEPPVGHTWVSGHAVQLVQREAGEPAPTIGDALAAALAFTDLDPSACFGAYPQSVPSSAQYTYGSVMVVKESGLVVSTPPQLAGWQEQFSNSCPRHVPLDTGAVGAAGAVTVVRFANKALVARSAHGDTTVPASPIELGVAFAELVGIQPTDCWSIFEGSAGMTRSERPEDAYVSLLYRRREDDAEGRQRFADWLSSIGLSSGDVDYGHPEGELAMAKGRFKVYRDAR
jgi:hypothetical protein